MPSSLDSIKRLRNLERTAKSLAVAYRFEERLAQMAQTGGVAPDWFVSTPNVADKVQEHVVNASMLRLKRLRLVRELLAIRKTRRHACV